MSYQNLSTEMEDETKERETLASNIMIMVISMILIALVTVAAVGHLGKSDERTVSTTTLVALCGRTDEPEKCPRFLNRIGEKSEVINYVKASINATLDELLVVNIGKPDIIKALTPLQTQTYFDCLEYLKFGKEELVTLYTLANSAKDMPDLNTEDFINSLSALISYQQTCINELTRTNSYEIMGYSLQVPILISRITLAIVTNFAERSPQLSETQRLAQVASSLRPPEYKLTEVGGELVIVAQDKSGHFSTISEALSTCQNKSKDVQCIIYVKKGIYKERVVVPRGADQVVMYGDGPLNTIVTGINAEDTKIINTPLRVATLVVMGKGFICKDMGFSAPPGIARAPAVLVTSDHTAFYNCKIDGEESSLYAVAQRQFYRDCEILGSVDIIKGDSTTMIQNSQIIVKPPSPMSFNNNLVLGKNAVVCAQYKSDRYERTGFVLHNCTIIAQAGNSSSVSLPESTYLGTPRSEYSTTIIMQSFIGDVIHPKGWCPWSDNYGIDTAIFREYNNTGPSAATDERVLWGGYQTIIKENAMKNYTAANFIQADRWLRSAAIPYELEFVSSRGQ